MSELKPGWRRVKFGEVVRQVKDKVDPATSGLERYVAGEHMETDDLRIRQWGDVGDGYLGPAFHMRFRPGHVLYGSRRTYLRKVAVADFEGICANTTFVLEPTDPRVLLPELLPFIMSTEGFHDHSKRESKGSVNPYVNFSDLAWYEFGLPPVQEQQRLVRLLSSIRDASDNLATAIDAGGVMDRASLSHFFPTSGGLSSTFLPLAECCERITDGTHLPPPLSDHGVPFLLVGNISSGAVDWNIEKWVSEETYQELTRHFRPRRGDVLYSLVGFTLGVPVLVDWDTPFVFQRHIGVVRPDGQRLDSRYLKHFLRSPLSAREDRRREEGGRQKTVSLTSLRQYRLPVPALQEQRSIADQLDGTESCARALRERTATISQLARTVLRTAGI